MPTPRPPKAPSRPAKSGRPTLARAGSTSRAASAGRPAPAEQPAALGAEGASLREEQLVQLAAELFARKGFDGTSLRDIADAAGITKAALYYWFPEKTSLFVRVVSARLDKLVERVTQAVAQESDPLQRIRAFLRCSAGLIDSDRVGWMASSGAFWSNFDPQVRRQLVPQRDRFEGLLRQCVNEAMASGALRRTDAALATRLLLSALNFLPRWHRPDGPMTAVQVIEAYLDMALQGLQASVSGESSKALRGRARRA